MARLIPLSFVQAGLFAATIAFGVVAAMPALADEEDQDRARQAMLRGEVRPLVEVIESVESTYEGEIIEVELEEEGGRLINGEWQPLLLYEIKLLTPQGNLVKLEYDARNLELLTVDGHDSESARKDREDEKEDD